MNWGHLAHVLQIISFTEKKKKIELSVKFRRFITTKKKPYGIRSIYYGIMLSAFNRAKEAENHLF